MGGARHMTVVAAVTVLVSACGTELSESHLELGTGAAAFVPLADGDFLDVYMGTQGGMHAFGSVRVRGLLPGSRMLPRNDPSQPRVHFAITREDEMLADVEYMGPLTESEEVGTYELVGVVVRIFLPEVEPPSPADIAGQTLSFATSVSDDEGHAAEASVTVIAREGI